MELSRALELMESGEYFRKKSPGMACGFNFVQIIDVDSERRCIDDSVGSVAYQQMNNYQGTKFTTTRMPLAWLEEYDGPTEPNPEKFTKPKKKRTRKKKTAEVEQPVDAVVKKKRTRNKKKRCRKRKK